MDLNRYILDEQGNPQPCEDLLTWAKWHEGADRQICKTEAEDGTLVSTVFLGLNHAFHDGPPLLFETMIFGGAHDLYQDRYATKAEAIEGHERAVAMLTTPTRTARET